MEKTTDKIQNASIRRVSLGYEDHGFLTAWVHLEYEGGGQGFGGFALGTADRTAPDDYLGVFVRGVLKAAGADSWESLQGKPVRVIAEHSKVRAIGHFLKDDAWFEPAKAFACLRK